jgi:hypothetical protein
LLRLPRLAARAAPAAICCFLDFAGIRSYWLCQGRGKVGVSRMLTTAS